MQYSVSDALLLGEPTYKIYIHKKRTFNKIQLCFKLHNGRVSPKLLRFYWYYFPCKLRKKKIMFNQNYIFTGRLLYCLRGGLITICNRLYVILSDIRKEDSKWCWAGDNLG